MTVTNSTFYSSVKHKSAYANLQLYNLEGNKNDLEKAIGLFLESLTVRTLQDYPLEYGITKGNLALAYHKQALIQDFDYNTKMAITAFDEALRIFTRESYPMQYGAFCNNFGNVYLDLGNIHYQRNDIPLSNQNWLSAIERFSESVKVFKDTHHEIRASILITRGALYQNLAMLDIELEKNSKLALDDFNESLKIYTLEQYPDKYATLKYNIGVTYMKLYTIVPNGVIYQSSVSAFKDATEIFDKNSEGYYDSQFNLGNVYLNKTDHTADYTAEECKNAINSYMISLKWHENKQFSFEYAMTWYNIGRAYSKLMHLENKEQNHQKMVEAFSNSMIVITDKNFPDIYRNIQNIMRDNRL